MLNLVCINAVRKFLFLFLMLAVSSSLISQNLTQTIRGKVIDKQSKSPIIGANVILQNSDPIKGAVTDIDGNFRLENVAIGRQSIVISFIGYKSSTFQNLLISAQKETILNIELEEKVITGKEVVIYGSSDKREAQNKMATVSARTFSIEETQKYAGSLNDVARMAQNFAGVQSGDDTRNDLIIRGNSSVGVLYRLDGVDIPNPNHFAFFGSTGGPISILNNNVLSNSDFFTGAFPAEFGNAFAGAFDLKMRAGNNEKHEFMGQFGINGFEGMAEGPIKKSKSSYLLNLRYNDLELYKSLGVNIGTQAVPTYFDGTLKLNFQQTKGATQFFAMGGKSFIEFLNSDRGENETFFDNEGEDLRYGTDIFVSAISQTYLLKKGFIKGVISYQNSNNSVEVDTIGENNPNPFNTYNNSSGQGKISAYVYINLKLNSRNLIKSGLFVNQLQFDLNESFFRRDLKVYFDRQKFDGETYLYQPYAQWQFKVNQKLTLNSGVHVLYYTFNNTSNVEPRLGFKYELNPTNVLSFGYGKHSQVPPGALYYKNVLTPNGSLPNPNKSLEMFSSHHFVLGYDKFINERLRLKAETYFQYLVDVPVDVKPSTYSILNQGAGFSFNFPDTLTNQGKGRNYGVELTLERFLKNGFYYLATVSLFESWYQPSDEVWYQTAFSTNYAINLLSGKEFRILEHKAKRANWININGRLVYNGGQRFTPILLEESIAAKEPVFDFSRNFEQRYQDYFRLDIKVGWRFDGSKISQEFAFDLQNITNRKNIFNEEFNPDNGEVITRYQLGRLPVVQYRIYF